MIILSSKIMSGEQSVELCRRKLSRCLVAVLQMKMLTVVDSGPSLDHSDPKYCPNKISPHDLLLLLLP